MTGREEAEEEGRIKGNCWNCDKPGHRAQDCWAGQKKGGQFAGAGAQKGAFQKGATSWGPGGIKGKGKGKGPT